MSSFGILATLASYATRSGHASLSRSFFPQLFLNWCSTPKVFLHRFKYLTAVSWKLFESQMLYWWEELDKEEGKVFFIYQKKVVRQLPENFNLRKITAWWMSKSFELENFRALHRAFLSWKVLKLYWRLFKFASLIGQNRAIKLP